MKNSLSVSFSQEHSTQLLSSSLSDLLSNGITSVDTHRLVWVSRIHGTSHHQADTILPGRSQDGGDLEINHEVQTLEDWFEPVQIYGL